MTTTTPLAEREQQARRQWLIDRLLYAIQFHIWSDATAKEVKEVFDSLLESDAYDDQVAAIVQMPKYLTQSEVQEVVDRAFTRRPPAFADAPRPTSAPVPFELAQAVLIERDACARLCDEQAKLWRASMVGGTVGYCVRAEACASEADKLAEGIRARPFPEVAPREQPSAPVVGEREALRAALEQARSFIRGNFVIGAADSRTTAGRVIDAIDAALAREQAASPPPVEGDASSVETERG